MSRLMLNIRERAYIPDPRSFSLYTGDELNFTTQNGRNSSENVELEAFSFPPTIVEEEWVVGV